MTLREDPISGELRLVAPGRSARLGPRPSGCPFCTGNEEHTPPETGRIAPRERDGDEAKAAGWTARSFPNLFPLTDPHEVLVPSPRHVTAWHDLTLPELEAGLQLLLVRHQALQEPGRYVHAFANDGTDAGASLPHVHAQLVSVPDGVHTERLTAGVRGDDCALCAVIEDPDSPLVVERGLRYAIIAHPLPRMGGALLLTPLAHDTTVHDEPISELAALLNRALQVASPDSAMNLWLVADQDRDVHWYLEIQPRSAKLAGVEMALGLNVCAVDPAETASIARERLGLALPSA